MGMRTSLLRLRIFFARVGTRWDRTDAYHYDSSPFANPARGGGPIRSMMPVVVASRAVPCVRGSVGFAGSVEEVLNESPVARREVKVEGFVERHPLEIRVFDSERSAVNPDVGEMDHERRPGIVD